MQDEDDPPQTSTARLFYAKHGFERAGDARPFQIRLDDSSIGSDEDRTKPNPLSQLLAMKSQLHHMAVAILASLALVQQGCAVKDSFARTNVDSAFSAGLAKVKQSTGFIEDPPGHSSTDWKPNLQLLVGVKAVEGSKRTIHFVELTTVRPPLTNAAGCPWQPYLHTNGWSWSPTNKA